jgi:hypothetical protein
MRRGREGWAASSFFANPKACRLSVAYDKHARVQVTEKALVKRLQRSLRRKGEYLRTADAKRQRRWGLGRYYLLDTKCVINKDVNIERLARDLRLLRPWEEIK